MAKKININLSYCYMLINFGQTNMNVPGDLCGVTHYNDQDVPYNVKFIANIDAQNQKILIKAQLEFNNEIELYLHIIYHSSHDAWSWNYANHHHYDNIYTDNITQIADIIILSVEQAYQLELEDSMSSTTETIFDDDEVCQSEDDNHCVMEPTGEDAPSPFAS